MNQKEAVFTFVTQICSSNNLKPTELSREVKKDIVKALMVGFVEGSIQLFNTDANKSKLADLKKLEEYCSGLLNNWLRKDIRLNGGVKYEPKYRRTQVEFKQAA